MSEQKQSKLVSDLSLPARGNSGNDNSERIYRTALAPKDYLRLEVEAMDRGLKPYGLTKSVMTLYLHKHLIYLKELPEELQKQITAHFKTNQSTRVF
ncbi:MAG: hypothetical protein M8364_18435 [Methylobacter sp.]|uniref:hypothetical protein n=1 Tax=Methylobacter sp. TaxID=2051955 RepID=UPI0025865864|nr:hypothetical protein [Methylobacter sp.]MCL7422872.1 hypothetical protein [Methylobacter sp.]